MFSKKRVVLAGLAIFSVLLISLSLSGNVYAKSRLDEIRERGHLILGAGTNAPFCHKNSEGVFWGFDIDVAEYIAKKIGVPIGKMVTVNGAMRITALEEGLVDLVASTMTHTKSRDSKIDYSITYFYDGQKLLTKKSSGIKSHRDLAGKKVGVSLGTTSARNIARIQPEAKIVRFSLVADVFRALEQDLVDAITNDSTLLLGVKVDSQNPDDYAIVGEFFSDEPYGLGVPQDDSKWRDFVNECLIEMWDNGTWLKIYNKYFGAGKRYELPLDFQMHTWPQR